MLSSAAGERECLKARRGEQTYYKTANEGYSKRPETHWSGRKRTEKKRKEKKSSARGPNPAPHRPVVMLPFGRFETTSSSIAKKFGLVRTQRTDEFFSDC
jgi:hypothetical protein